MVMYVGLPPTFIFAAMSNAPSVLCCCRAQWCSSHLVSHAVQSAVTRLLKRSCPMSKSALQVLFPACLLLRPAMLALPCSSPLPIAHPSPNMRLHIAPSRKDRAQLMRHTGSRLAPRRRHVLKSFPNTQFYARYAGMP